MCGILGLIGSPAADPDSIQRALTLMAHRGPDGSGLWSSPDGRVHLAHGRLSILDLSERGVSCERRLKQTEDRAQRREEFH